MTKSNYEINSLVEILVKEKESNNSTHKHHLASLDGYIGPTEKNYVRIYSGLDLGEYVDIPESEIVNVTYTSEKPEDACRVIFKADCDLRYVQTATFKPLDVIGSHTTNGSSGSVARIDNNGSELPPQNCELICEMRRGSCEEFGMGWCGFKYYLCRLDCIYSGISGGTRGVARL